MVWGHDELFQKGRHELYSQDSHPHMYVLKSPAILSCALTSFLPTVYVSSACVALNFAEQLIKADAGYWTLPHA